MQIVIWLDGREFVSEVVRPQPASVREFAASFSANLPQLTSFQMVLADGAALVLSKEALQRAVFLFRESAALTSPIPARTN